MSTLQLAGIEHAYGGAPVLRGVDLTVEAGSVAAVLGPSGCGKTTLLRVVAGFLRPDAGTVALDGRPVDRLPPERRRVGIVPQEGALFPHLTVAGNVGYGLPRARGRAARQAATRVGELLDLVGLGGFGERWPAELSGGQQQRVAVARALAPDPSLVLLDEPFSALDTGLRAEVRADVVAALRTAGATAVLVTHDQEEALSAADLVAVMRDGRVVQAAPPVDLYRTPADLGVATFVGEAVVLPGHARGARVATALGELPVAGPARTGAVAVVVRPEQLVLGGPGVPATLSGRVFLGHDALLRLRLADGTAVTARSFDAAALVLGAPVEVAVRGPVCVYPT